MIKGIFSVWEVGGKSGKWLQDLGIPKGAILESVHFPGTEPLPAVWAHEFRLNQYSTRESLRPKDCYNSSSLSKIQERLKLCCCLNWTAPCPRSTFLALWRDCSNCRHLPTWMKTFRPFGCYFRKNISGLLKGSKKSERALLITVSYDHKGPLGNGYFLQCQPSNNLPGSYIWNRQLTVEN